ncbi:unnamed protein product [Durusdinium trenchii]|uniref:Integrase catalytic domain-containing protein n=1 Tax=Durusdinium trenchii TaxID=1381693 RepID=A0ABP0M123_9DINO
MEAAELAVAFDLLWLREVQALSQRLPLVTLPPGRGPVLWAAPFGAAYGLHPGVPQPQGPRLPPSERDHSAAPALAVVLQELRLWVRAQCLRLPALLMALPQECPQAQSGPSQTGSPNPPRGMNSSTNPDGLSGASGYGPGSANAFMDRLNANSATASSPPPVASAFEALGQAPMTTSSTSAPTDPAVAGDQVVKALTAALTGQVENLRSWLRSLAFWELDNNIPKSKWGLKLLMSFPENSASLAATIDMTVTASEHGYGAILSAIFTKYAPFLEAAAPAAIDAFFFGPERSRSESFSAYIATKELALQDMEAQVGEKMPPRIAGRILLKTPRRYEPQEVFEIHSDGDLILDADKATTTSTGTTGTTSSSSTTTSSLKHVRGKAANALLTTVLIFCTLPDAAAKFSWLDPPRSAASVVPSIALDLTTGWDFKLAGHREEARNLVKTKRPGVLLLSPPCTTRLTNYKRHPWEVQQEEQEGDLHMDYAVSLAEDQLDNGPVPGALAKKPTLLATNIEELCHYVERSCDKSHAHGPLIGGGAHQAAIYTPEFVKALVDRIKENLGYKTMNQRSKHEPTTDAQYVKLGRGRRLLDQVLDTFLRLWAQHYGAPVDRGREFFSQKFVEAVASLGVGIHFTDPGSPWHNSRAEKAGGLVKEKLAATLLETSASPAELKTALAEVVAARNRFMDRFGFSPMQRVFGKNLRLPASLLSTDALDRELVELSANEQIQRIWSIRDAAMTQWLRRQDRSAIRRLWKASLEQIRRATPEEELGAELVVELSKELMDKLQQPGQVVYQDVTAEGHPEDGEFPEDAVRRVLRITEDTGQGDRLEPPPPSSAESAQLRLEEDTLPDTGAVPGTDHSRRASMEIETEEPFVPEPMETISEDQLAATPMASFCERDQCLYVTKAKTSFGQVEFGKLAEEEKKLFREARKKELDSLPKELDPNTISEFKRRAMQEGHMEAVPLQVDQRNPKSRWCVVGWQDPDVLEVERSSPAPLSTSIYTCLQLAASRQWKTHIKDVKTAFLQGRPTTRTRRLACRQPRDEALPGLHPDQLLLLETEVYGLVSGPSWWRCSLLGIAEKLGYKVCPYDRCVLTLPGEKADEMTPTDGFMVIDVDDIAEAGNDRHRAKMEELRKLLKFGKIEALFDSNGSSYAGRQIKQNKDYSFEMNMEEFIYTRLEPIKLNRRVLKKDAASMLLNEAEKTQLRGLIASLNWIAREARPDASAAASLLASAFPSPSMSHILSANDIVAHLKTFPVTLKVHAIKESKLRNILISDSAFDTSGKDLERSQHGWLLGYTDDTMNRGALAPVSLMQWRSKRLRRKASSSLLCEAISMSAATAALERQDAMMEAISKSHFNPRRRQRNEDDLLEPAGKATVIASQSGAFPIVFPMQSLYGNAADVGSRYLARSNLEPEASSPETT